MDRSCIVLPEKASRGIRCSSGGHDVVNDENSCAGNVISRIQAKSLGDILKSFGHGQCPLLEGATSIQQKVRMDGRTKFRSESFSNRLGGRNSAFQTTPPMHRNGNHGIDRTCDRSALELSGKQLAHGAGQRFVARMLAAQYNVSKTTGINAESNRGIEFVFASLAIHAACLLPPQLSDRGGTNRTNASTRISETRLTIDADRVRRWFQLAIASEAAGGKQQVGSTTRNSLHRFLQRSLDRTSSNSLQQGGNRPAQRLTEAMHQVDEPTLTHGNKLIYRSVPWVDAMLILDRYIFGQFAKVLFVAFFALTSLYVIIDAFNNLEEFQILAERQGRNILIVVQEYYRIQTFALFDKTYGMLALLATMATISWFHRTRELTALLAGGISKWRFVRPILVASLGVSLLGVLNREWWMPIFRSQLTRNAQDWVSETPRPFTPRFDQRSDIFLSGKGILRASQRLERPNFRLPPSLSQFGDKLVAERADYQAAESDKPAGFRLTKVERPERIGTIESAYIDGNPVLLTANDTEWLEANECFVVSNLTFDQLASGDQWQRFSSTNELIGELGNPSSRVGADTRVLIHSRVIQPILDMTLVFLGLPLVLRREHNNLFVAVGWGLLVICGFSAIVVTFQTMGANYLLRPVFATWCPVFLLVPTAVFLSRPLQE